MMSSRTLLRPFQGLSVFILLVNLLAGCTSLPSVKPLSKLHNDLAKNLGPKATEFQSCSLRRFAPTNLPSGPHSMGSTENASNPEIAGPTPPHLHLRLDTIRTELQSILDRSQAPHKLGGEIDKLLSILKDPAERHNIDLAIHRDAFHSFVDAAKQIQMDLILDDLLKKPTGPRSLFEQLLVNYYRAYFGALEVEAGANKADPKDTLHAQFVTKGFIDRNGNSYAFPGLSVDVTLMSNDRLSFHASTVDSKRLTSDSVRILLEAFFDAAFSVPADDRATATMIVAANYPKWSDLGSNDASTGSEITKAAVRAETLVTSAIGEAIRGGILFSLNNETLAAGIETAAGVTAKKLVEYEVFCYFKAKGLPTTP